ncbi:DUF6314 family protein [Thalassobium sp. R2A62]|jgi:hypothetical protein|uniref:DUF6314 family protein n=1 Tax=Thalassobium sp. R2A62 TaxID=633131 RepID=UPI0001B1CEE3|nr:DUF6314 family protein [Thalassobium sp. R2A62]EET47870.1 hypothetical protein TR2A62_0390 [Thalassobium sp. R2A62]
MLGPDDFRGTWQVSRVIADAASGTQSLFAGIAEFSEQGTDQLAYREQGQMTLPDGTTLAATRGYQWTFSKDRVWVGFEEGQPFHDFSPQGHEDGTEHLCINDLYRVRYDFAAFPVWSATYRVTGPRKDYNLRSLYHRG